MKDTLFQDNGDKSEDFSFTPKVAEVFDDMLERSVPFYRESLGMAAQILRSFLEPCDKVYDLGCSTGTTLIHLSRKLDDLNLDLIGVDNSQAMIEKAQRKAEAYSKKDRLQFVEADILDVEIRKAGAILLNYTMQFIRPLERQVFLQRMHSALKPGGIILISEKTICQDSVINRSFIEFYLDFKRNQGYSELEITKKREALENILVPFSKEENMTLLRKAGFQKVDQYFQWFNFSSFMAIK